MLQEVERRHRSTSLISSRRRSVISDLVVDIILEPVEEKRKQFARSISLSLLMKKGSFDFGDDTIHEENAEEHEEEEHDQEPKQEEQYDEQNDEQDNKQNGEQNDKQSLEENDKQSTEQDAGNAKEQRLSAGHAFPGLKALIGSLMASGQKEEEAEVSWFCKCFVILYTFISGMDTSHDIERLLPYL